MSFAKWLVLAFFIGAASLANAMQPSVYSVDGVAIGGYDPVGYFDHLQPVKGSPEYAAEWSGATWHFASEANRSRFLENPELFAPQYGGYCAYAVSQGSIAKTEPDAFTIHDGKLYLNYDLAVQRIWRWDVPGNIEAADENWPGVLDD